MSNEHFIIIRQHLVATVKRKVISQSDRLVFKTKFSGWADGTQNTSPSASQGRYRPLAFAGPVDNFTLVNLLCVTKQSRRELFSVGLPGWTNQKFSICGTRTNKQARTSLQASFI